MVKKALQTAKQAISLWILLAFFSSSAFALFGNKNANLEQRVQRLEQITDARTDYDLQNRIQELQEAISQLQGQIEVQNNQLRNLEQQQQAMYSDLDNKINKMTGENPPNSQDLGDADRATPVLGEELGDTAIMSSVPVVGPSGYGAMPSQAAPPSEPLIEQTVPGHR